MQLLEEELRMVTMFPASIASRTNTCSGIYKFYAVDILTLEDKPGFPVLIDGNFADNDPTR